VEEPVARRRDAASRRATPTPAARLRAEPRRCELRPPRREAEAEAASGPSTRGPKPKKKRLPRSERPQALQAEAREACERKPITAPPKPEAERGRDQQRRGVVVSAAMDKTIVVRVDSIKSHPKYKKVIRRSTKFHAHDEQNQAKAGDLVRIVETRPLSKTKRWRLAEILEVAK
jgi:small subunit ribosomal protein S17